jgi:hypothetical protein
MKPMWIAAAALAVTLAVTGCKHRKEEPVPPPKATWATARVSATPVPVREKTANTSTRRDAAASHHGASGISWFQGTIDEAFSTSCPKCATLLRHGASRP